MTGILRIEMRRSLLVRLSPLAAAALVALMVNDIHTWLFRFGGVVRCSVGV